MKYFLNRILIAVFLGVASYANAADPQAVSCDIYDAATGTKLNDDAGTMVDGQCQVGVNTNSLSSSSAQILIRVTLDNGVQLKALEEGAASQFLSGKKEVTSSVTASPSGMLAYYQGLVGGGASCLSQSSSNALSEKCLEGMRFQQLREVVAGLKQDSSASGQSMGAMARVMRGFLNSGGAEGIKDPLEFLKRLNNGDSSMLNRAPDLARAGGEITDADALKKNFLLMHKLGQIAAMTLQEKNVQTKFAADEIYKKKYFDFLKALESPDQAVKVAAAGANTLKAFFKDVSIFESTYPKAARELFIKEADSNFADFADAQKMSALFKTLASTDCNGRSLEEIQRGINFISGYVHFSSDAGLIAEKAGVIAQFIANNFGVIDATKLDSAYFDSFQQQLQQKSSGDFLNTFSFQNFSSDGSPLIISHTPVNEATDVRASSTITVAFDREIDPASVEVDHFVVRCENGLIDGAVSYNAQLRSIQFTPASLLPFDNDCSATVSDFRSLSGKTLASASWKWIVERAPFKIVSLFPKDDSRDVASDSSIRVQFNYPIDRSTAEGAVVIENCKVDGLFVIPVSGKEIDFTPGKKYKELVKGAGCQVKVSPNLRDIFGRTLGESNPAHFYLAK